MTSHYYNYTTFLPNDWWGRRSFVNAWWRFYRSDPRWAPPDYRSFSTLIHDRGNRTGQQIHTQPIYMEALPHRSGDAGGYYGSAITGAYFEETVAAAVIQVDERRDDGAAYLSLLRCANDEETLERLLGKVMEVTADFGCERLIGPMGSTLSWQFGALQNHFNVVPPLHTPYNPPYLPDLLSSTMQPLLETALFTIDTPPDAPEVAQVATIVAMDPARLSGDLLPLFAMSSGDTGFFPAPDEAEAATLLRWLRVYPLTGWLAQIEAEVVGFVLVQPDFAPLMRATGGGRRLPWQWHTALRRPPDRGRVLLGAVAEEWRGTEVAQQLWDVALRHAQHVGWRVLTCGPVPLESAAARFLQRMGARAQQRYMLYEWTPW